MVYTVTKIIADAFKVAKVRGREIETITAIDLQVGLELLNSLFSLTSISPNMVPYYSEYVSNFVPNQEKYFIPNIIDASTITFIYGNNNSLRLPIYFSDRKEYFGSSRVNNISVFPHKFRLEKTKGGADLYVYFLPNASYQFNIFGKFGYKAVVLNEDLSLTYDDYHIQYFKYLLSRDICLQEEVTPTPLIITKIEQIEEAMKDVSVPDVSVRNFQLFDNHGYDNLSNDEVFMIYAHMGMIN